MISKKWIMKKVDHVKCCCSFQQNKILFLQACTVMVLVCIVCYTYIQSEERRKISQELSEQRETKLILLWTKYFTQRDWLPSPSDLNCLAQCNVTSNRTLLANSSAVIMHWRNIDPYDLPKCVHENQQHATKHCPVLVLFNQEAPPHTPSNLILEINNKVHWTATYRRDSEVYSPYGKIEKRTDTYKIPDMNSSRSLVCWLVSHCNTPSSREIYVNNLKRHINVDVYGKCGDKRCPHQKSLDCYKWLSERCKFYLSFENSICKDYATEKLYNAMMTDMVPVVLGGDDYARYLPSHSFVDVADYSSPEALATYLKKLDKDDASYLSYFNWKKDYVAKPVEFGWICDLCERLHQKGVSNNLKPYKDLRTWWFDEAKCGSLT